MPPSRRFRLPRPALWIAVPTFLVGAGVAAVAWLTSSLPAALAVGLIGALAVGCLAEARLTAIISAIGKIATGDRYQSLPECIADGAVRDFAATAEIIRGALIKADTLTIDQCRRETEARLHHAGRTFFTGNFRRGVDEVVTAFTSAGERIRGTAADLAEINKQMARQVAESASAAT